MLSWSCSWLIITCHLVFPSFRSFSLYFTCASSVSHSIAHTCVSLPQCGSIIRLPLSALVRPVKVESLKARKAWREEPDAVFAKRVDFKQKPTKKRSKIRAKEIKISTKEQSRLSIFERGFLKQTTAMVSCDRCLFMSSC